MGTIHAGVNADELPDEVWDRLNQVNCFIMEADIDTIDAQEVQKRTLLPAGVFLDTQLQPIQWQTLQTMIPQVPAEHLRRLKPWAIVSVYWQTVAPDLPAMDLVLREKARHLKLTTIYLEDSAWQLDLLDQITTLDDIKDLVDHRDALPDLLNDLIQAYRRGNEKELSQLMLESRPGQLSNPEQLKRLLTDRNVTWVPKILTETKNQRCFIAVGAGHLFGPQGVVALLKQKGANPRRVQTH